MKLEDQRIAIAIACGWEVHGGENYFSIQKQSVGACSGPVNSIFAIFAAAHVPDYPSDLNAMHEAEKTLKDTRRGFYNAELSKAALEQRNLSSTVKEPEFIFQLVTATAAQRAEAFLRTIGKWVEE